MAKGNDNDKRQLDGLYKRLADADSTYKKLPLKVRLEVEKVSQGLTEFGPRKLRRRGAGTEFFETREFNPETDEPRRINARLSARAGKYMVAEKEAEIRQHFYLWRDATASMDYGSEATEFTKKEAAEVMMLAFAKHLARNDEMIGILDGKGLYRGGKASQALAAQMYEVSIITGDLPQPQRKLPQNSTVVMFSDFMTDHEQLLKSLGQINGMGLKGFLVMTLDPQELDFDFSGHIEFNGMEGEGTETFKKAEAMKKGFQSRMHEHIREIQRMCKAKGFRLILQRTDEPLHESLMQIYGLSANMTKNAPNIGAPFKM